MPQLTPEDFARIIAQLDDVIKQARDLQADLKSKMSERRRRDQQDVGQSRRSTPTKKTR